jgi:hypothetical protein
MGKRGEAARLKRVEHFKETLRDRFKRVSGCQDNPELALAFLPQPDDAETLARHMLKETVTMAELCEIVGSTETEISAMRKDFHLKALARRVNSLNTLDKASIAYYLKSIKEHLEGAGFEKNINEGLSKVGSSLSDVRMSLVLNCSRYGNSDGPKEAEAFMSVLIPR